MSWASPQWGLSTLVHSFTAGVGGGLGHAAAQGIVHAVTDKAHEHKQHKLDKAHAVSAPNVGAAQAQVAQVPSPAEPQPVAGYYVAPTMPACAPPARPPPSVHTHATVLRDFEPHTPAEVRVTANEVVELLHPDPSGWTEVLTKDGRRGWVPSTFLGTAQ